MEERQYDITILPSGRVLRSFGGDSLYTLLLVAGLISPKVPRSERLRLEKGAVSPSEDPEAEAAVFTPAELLEGWLLASCRRINGDATLRLGTDAEADRQLYDPLADGFGLAFDIGAGTIAAGLVNLDTMKVPLTSAWRNSQLDIAVDLAERLYYARVQADGAERLRQALLNDLNSLTGKLMAKAGVSGQAVKAVTCAGNNALLKILLGQAEQQQGLVGRYKASALSWSSVGPDCEIYVLPAAAADIGADTISACLATGMLQRKERQSIDLLIDLGMSGEIIAAGRGRLLAASIPSLPFEGAGISSGMQSTTGAITSVQIDDDVLLKTVRSGRPRGLSGAGLLAAVRALRERGLLDNEGRLLIPEGTPEKLASRMRSGAGGREFVLSRGDRYFPADICLNQDDILKVQMGKGAIFAACQAMLAALEAATNDIGEIMIAEAYRANFHPEALLSLAMIPPVAPEQVRSIGNASWQGAYLALSNRRYLEEARETAAAIQRLDLNTDPVYAEQFIIGMNF